MEIIFYSHPNKTHFQKKGCALGLILKVRRFGNRRWSGLLRFIPWGCLCEIKIKLCVVIGDIQRTQIIFPAKRIIQFTLYYLGPLRSNTHFYAPYNKGGGGGGAWLRKCPPPPPPWVKKMPFKVENAGVARGQNKPFSKTLRSKLL